MLSLGRIVTLDLVVANLFMRSRSGMYDSTLLGHSIFYTEGAFLNELFLHTPSPTQKHTIKMLIG